MSSVTREKSTPMDYALWLLVAAVLIAGMYANSIYAEQPLALRILVGIFVVAFAGFIASRTVTGQHFVGFIGDARMEMRKVVWPTRKETIQMSWVVVAMVILMSVILWIADSSFMVLIGWLTGQRG